MMEKYLYFTKARIVIILLTIISLVGLPIRLKEAVTWQEALLNLSIMLSLAFILGGLEAEWITHPPKGLYDDVVEYKGDSFSLNGALGEKAYDKDENEIGICTGVYFTENAIRFMVGDHLYDLSEVYFEEEEE